MREDFLHYLWKFKKIEVTHLKTTTSQPIVLVKTGFHNQHSGPDFFNAQLKIDGQLWAGNVEIHLKSSDWYLHRHEIDENYDSVILHVVWEHDAEIFRKDNTIIPTLVLKPYVNSAILRNFETLSHSQQKWIPCETNFASFPGFEMEHWLERVYLERLEERSSFLEQLYKDSIGNWEAMLFQTLAKYFGLNVNGDAFFSLAKSLEFELVRKCSSRQFQLEALFLGQSGLLNSAYQNAYLQNLQKEYHFLKSKFKLDNSAVLPMKFFRLRPSNFPTLRLAQLAALYHKHASLFSKIKQTMDTARGAGEIGPFYDLLTIEVSDFWKSHFNFGKSHPPKAKMFTSNFKDLLLVNAIIPFYFFYLKHFAKAGREDLLEIMKQVKAEKNSILSKFNELRPGIAQNALNGQALLQLKKRYCDPRHCLSCSLGIRLLENNNLAKNM